MYKTTIKYDGFSTCSRRWKGEETLDTFLHGVSMEIKITFAAEALDPIQQVFDYRSNGYPELTFPTFTRHDRHDKFFNLVTWLAHMFDNTVLISQDDPFRHVFEQLEEASVIRLRTLPSVGSEALAVHIYDVVKPYVEHVTDQRTTVSCVQVIGHRKIGGAWESNQ